MQKLILKIHIKNSNLKKILKERKKKRMRPRIVGQLSAWPIKKRFAHKPASSGPRAWPFFFKFASSISFFANKIEDTLLK